MREYKLILVAGARPNFMKIAPIIRELRKDRDQKTEDRRQMLDLWLFKYLRMSADSR